MTTPYLEKLKKFNKILEQHLEEIIDTYNETVCNCDEDDTNKIDEAVISPAEEKIADEFIDRVFSEGKKCCSDNKDKDVVNEKKCCGTTCKESDKCDTINERRDTFTSTSGPKTKDTATITAVEYFDYVEDEDDVADEDAVADEDTADAPAAEDNADDKDSVDTQIEESVEENWIPAAEFIKMLKTPQDGI